MSFLLDTNVLSELRKKERGHPGVARWFGSIDEDEIYVSVVVVGEIRRGIEAIRRRDRSAGLVLDRWLKRVITTHASRILTVDMAVAEQWGRLNVPDPLPVVDGLLAATAHVHGLTLVTRNTKDIERTGVPFLNPFL